MKDVPVSVIHDQPEQPRTAETYLPTYLPIHRQSKQTNTDIQHTTIEKEKVTQWMGKSSPYLRIVGKYLIKPSGTAAALITYVRSGRKIVEAFVTRGICFWCVFAICLNVVVVCSLCTARIAFSPFRATPIRLD